MTSGKILGITTAWQPEDAPWVDAEALAARLDNEFYTGADEVFQREWLNGLVGETAATDMQSWRDKDWHRRRFIHDERWERGHGYD